MKIEYILTSYIGRYVGRYVGSGTFTGLLRGFEEIRNWKFFFARWKNVLSQKRKYFMSEKKIFHKIKTFRIKSFFQTSISGGNSIQLHEIAPTESMSKKQRFSQNKNISHKNVFPDFNFRGEFNTSLSITREKKT